MNQPPSTLDIFQGDNLKILSRFDRPCFDLIYMDPPFNTGRTQKAAEGTYADTFEDYSAFLEPRLKAAFELLDAAGTLCVHLDYREVHYVKVLLDRLVGRECFLNEIIWAYDFGGRAKKRWSAKHDTLLLYVKDAKEYTFRFDDMERIPYMAPGLAGPEKAARGKTPTDVWWHTVVHTRGKERCGYPTQKPVGLLNRLITVHTHPGDLVLDCFAGSGTTGEAALKNGRSAVLIDSNPDAIKVMMRRLEEYSPRLHPESHA